MELKVEPGVRKIRCQKCYRLHDLIYIEISNTISTGYKCPFHKNASSGFYFLAKYYFVPKLRILTERIYGHIKEIKPAWYEVQPIKDKTKELNSMQLQFDI